MKNLIKLIILVFLASCASKEDKTTTDNLVEAKAPDAMTEKEQGYLLPGMSHGLLQSPINIVTKNVETGMHEVTVHYKTSKEKLLNLGHTVQVNYDEGSSIDFDDKNYGFKQFHFHTPSEHHVDGITYPLEMHMVHECDSHTENPDKPLYLVIGILFREGEENSFLNEFINAIPPDEGGEVELENMFIDISTLISDNLSHFFYYKGSLTTPPFTESVNWMILKQIYEASPEQIKKLNLLEGNNARHIQAVYDRKVESI
ncbi:MAG: carbonic anhydrase family protein [Bacteroidota bacterium]